MRRLTVLAAMVLGAIAVLVIPSSASAGIVNDCAYAQGSGQTTNTQTVGTGTVTVYADTDGGANGGGGPSGQADVAAGACADNLAPAQGFDGGHVDAGAGSPTGAHAGQAYAIVDGDNENVDPTGFGDGYIGVSNFETGAKTTEAQCTASGPDQPAPQPPPSTNSGGCVGIDKTVPVVGGTWAPVPLIACGNTSGNDWSSTNRDGCSIP